MSSISFRGIQTTVLWDIMRYHHPTLFFSKFGWYRYPKLASWILLDPRIGYLQVSPSFSMISIDLLSIYKYMDCIHDTDPPRKTDTFRQVINPSTQHSQHPARGERLENADLLHHQHHRLADVDLGASASDLLLLQRCLVRKVGIGKRNDRCVCILYIDYIVVIPE